MWFTVLLILIGLATFLYFYFTRNFGYFKSKGITEAPSYFPFGSYNSYKMFTGKISFINLVDDIYIDYPNDKIVGTFSMDKPALVINDLELAKQVLIKDFDYFTDRRTFELNTKQKANKVFSEMLTMLTGEKWKTMRNLMSPVFTSGKLKTMTSLINKVGHDFVKCLNEVSAKDEEFNGKEMMTSYTLDAIANCGLGVEAHAFTEPDGIFRKMVAKATGNGRANPMQMAKLLLILAAPSLAKTLNLSFIDPSSIEFFHEVITKTIKSRSESKTRRNDFVDLVLDAIRNSDKVNGPNEVEDDQFEKDAVVQPQQMQKITESEYESLLVSNILLLFFAGFDTSSTIMSVCMYYLAKNPEIQQELYNEVADTIQENNGSQDLDYNTVHSMKYLDMVIHETLRLYPLTILERVCVKDYKLPGFDLTLPKGMIVQVPSSRIMRDEKYFSNPNDFDPQHFSAESKSSRNPYAFLAFGQGPRNCIGMRFALLQVKISIIRAVANFTIVPGPSCPDKIEVDPMSTSGQPKGGVWVKVHKRQEN